jgi:hypothetical protein
VTALLKDFGDAWSSAIIGNEVKPRMIVQAWPPLFWSADLDGLIATVNVCAPSGDGCLLTLLFPMPFGVAEVAAKRKRFPVFLSPGCLITVSKKVDEVTGESGERYSRFLCDEVLAT